MKIFEKIVALLRSYVGHLGIYFTVTVLLINTLGGKGRMLSPE